MTQVNLSHNFQQLDTSPWGKMTQVGNPKGLNSTNPSVNNLNQF